MAASNEHGGAAVIPGRPPAVHPVTPWAEVPGDLKPEAAKVRTASVVVLGS